jgi:hypothetical protein
VGWLARTGILLGVAGLALVTDLAAKGVAVAVVPHAVAYHAAGVPWRLVFLLPVAILGLPLLADRAGVAAIGLVVGGSLANTASLLLWRAGVPDFVPVPGGLANVADLEIGLGLVGVPVVIALPWLRERIPTRSRALPADAAVRTEVEQ